MQYGGAKSYSNTIGSLLDIHEAKKISDEEFVGVIRLISALTIISSFIGIFGKNK